MHPMPNRLGLGLRPPMQSYGQGPSISALAQQQQQMHFVPPQQQRHTTLFVGSISGGITDSFLNSLLSVSGTRTIISSYYLRHTLGLRTSQIIQALDHASKQTPRLWICRVRGARWCVEGNCAAEWCRAAGIRRWLCQQETTGASNCELIDPCNSLLLQNNS